MSTILATIAATKRAEIAALRRTGICGERSDAPRGFLRALRGRCPVGLIAELKKASPSRGVIRPDFQPEPLAAAYHAGGAHCLSVLTDRQYFQGEPAYLTRARRACPLPVLRKDFILDPLQIKETQTLNADAVLLIVALLDGTQLDDLFHAARAGGLDVLVEVHDEHEMERACTLAAPLVGINNRNLHDFSVTLDTTARVARYALPTMTVVSESGIFTPEDIAVVKAAGATAVLVGEALMAQRDVAAAVRALLAV
jgi:indole-3-glycerol phosphate synthase